MISKLCTLLARLSLGVSAALVAAVTCLILYGVASRYFLGASPIWFDELARYGTIASAMIAVGAVWIEGGHMRVGILESRVPASARRLIIFYQWALTVVAAGAMTWFSYKYVGSVGFFRTQGLQISRSWPVAVMPLGFGLLFVLALMRGPRAMASGEVEVDLPRTEPPQ